MTLYIMHAAQKEYDGIQIVYLSSSIKNIRISKH